LLFVLAIIIITAHIYFLLLGFIMVRKILEVKEVTRIAEEASLARSMAKSGDGPLPPQLE
jgi:hypothetical protein